MGSHSWSERLAAATILCGIPFALAFFYYALCVSRSAILIRATAERIEIGDGPPVWPTWKSQAMEVAGIQSFGIATGTQKVSKGRTMKSYSAVALVETVPVRIGPRYFDGDVQARSIVEALAKRYGKPLVLHGIHEPAT
jgi:hypothetical protein